jgi:hypothetical protein
MKLSTDIPCVNCITLSICKAKVNQNGVDKRALLQDVLEKCTLLNNYIWTDTDHSSDKHNSWGLRQRTLDKPKALKVIAYMFNKIKMDTNQLIYGTEAYVYLKRKD